MNATPARYPHYLPVPVLLEALIWDIRHQIKVCPPTHRLSAEANANAEERDVYEQMMTCDSEEEQRAKLTRWLNCVDWSDVKS